MRSDQKNAKKTNPKPPKNEQKMNKKRAKTNQNERKRAKFHPKNNPSNLSRKLKLFVVELLKVKIITREIMVGK